jgi:hypothetical protein
MSQKASVAENELRQSISPMSQKASVAENELRQSISPMSQKASVAESAETSMDAGKPTSTKSAALTYARP